MPTVWTGEEEAILKRYYDVAGPPYEIAQEVSAVIGVELGLKRSVAACRAKMKRTQESVIYPEDERIANDGNFCRKYPSPATPHRIQAISRRLAKAVHRKVAPTSKVKRILVYGDTHFTFHSQPAIDIMIDIARDIKPDTIIHNGDVLDCHELSSFDKTEPTESNLQAEVTVAKAHFVTMRETFPGAEYIVNEGNHDFRLIRYIKKYAEALFDLPELRLENLLGFKDLNIQFNRGVAGYSSYHLPHLLVGHFNKVNKWAGYTAKGLLDTMGMSIIQAHVHRLAMVYRTQPTRELVGVEGGCMCSLTPTYMEYADWQQGFCVITLFPGDEYQVQLVPIVTAGKRMFGIWGNEIYEQKL